MAFKPREGSGSLFKNDRKTTDSHPDYKGDGLVNGVPMEIAAWIKEGKNGKFMSLSIKPKQQTGGRAQTANPRAHGPDPEDDTDSVPF